MNPEAELYMYIQIEKLLYGFDYIKAITQIEQIVDYSQYAISHPDTSLTTSQNQMY